MKIISRKEAIEQNLPLFFTGKPCKYGHIAERRTGNSDCLVCAKERAAKNHIKNRDAVLARAAAYREANRETLRLKALAYYQETKEQHSEYGKKYREENKEKIREQQAAYREKNKEKAKKYKAEYYVKNKESITEKSLRYLNANREVSRKSSRKYRKNNPEKIHALTRLKQAEKLRRTPVWLTEDDIWMMREIYELAALRTKLTGVKWEVDHIIPLKGKIVSGLHVPSNLQVIPAAENRRKNNKWDPSNGE